MSNSEAHRQMFQNETDTTLNGISNGALAMALQRAQPFADAARAMGTQRVYGSAWRAWQDWCRLHHTAPLPAHPEAVAAYLGHLARAGRSVSSITVALAAVVHFNREAGHRLDRKHPAIANVVAGITRKNAKPIRRAPPLEVEDLRTIIRSIGEADLRALRDRALILTGFFGALRRSEIVSLDLTGRSPIEIRAEGLVLHLTATKASTATETVAVPRRTDELCPVAALEEYLAAADINGGSLFRAISKSGRVLDRRLDATSVRYVLQQHFGLVLGDGKEAAERLSPHSLRAGFISAAARAGAPEHAIARTSRHRSVAVLRGYIHRADGFESSAGIYF